jgi:hypothetical protein
LNAQAVSDFLTGKYTNLQLYNWMIAFGSYATGFARASSDLDVFVIKQSCGKPAARIRAVKRVLFGIFHPVDVFVFTPQEFEEAAYEEQSFTWVIVKQARLYRWTEEASRLIPSLLSKAAQSNLRKLGGGHSHD